MNCSDPLQTLVFGAWVYEIEIAYIMDIFNNQK